MKKIAVLMAAFLTLAPALAQGPNAGLPPKGIPVTPSRPLVPMAHKPLVYSNGHVLSRADKAQFIATARAAFTTSDTGSSAGPTTAPGAFTTRSIPTTETITIAEPTAASGFSLVAEDPYVWDPEHNALKMNPLGTARQSFLGIYVEVAPNTIYVLNFKVNSDIAGQYVIATAPTGAPGRAQPAGTPVGAHTAETVNAPQGEGGFAYAFDASKSGGVWIWVSAKTMWSFESVQLTPMPE